MIQLHETGGVAVIRIDRPDSSVNTLDLAAFRQLEEAFSEARQDTGVRAVVVTSGKPGHFLAGVDINLFTALPPEELRQVTEDGQRFFSRIADFPKPVVVAIDGACAGGGTELALACHYRLLSSSPGTSVSLPEVQLGLLPGLGGTQRLPRTAGLARSLDMMLSGRRMFAHEALRSGFADALHHAEGLEDAAVRAAQLLAAGKHPGKRARRSLPERLSAWPGVRELVLRQAEKQVRQRTRGNLPAPGRITGAVRRGLASGSDAGLRAEAEAFSELSRTREAGALMHVFFTRSATRRNPYAGEGREVRRIAVLGAGLMGAGIAQVSARAGWTVQLSDQTLAQAAAGRGRAWKDLDRQVGKGLSAFERDTIFERLRLAPDAAAAAAQADLTIEAVPEDLQLKRLMLRRVEAATPDTHVFATNTSSLPLHEIAAEAARPERVVGMHYFSPVPRMPLLEVVRSEKTSRETLATAVSAGLRQGKSVIVVADSPGFYVNRILAPYLGEALRLVHSGVPVEQVDGAMLDAGFPVGPLRLLDEVGLDVADSVNSVLAPLFAGRGLELSGTRALTAAGLTGRKGGAGFYRYGKGRKPEVNADVYRLLGATSPRTIRSAFIRERLLYSLVNEAILTLQEGVIASADTGDAGAVFGIGFPPFLGGPFRFLEDEGLKEALAMLDRLCDAYGERFEAAALLRKLVEQGGSLREFRAA